MSQETSDAQRLQVLILSLMTDYATTEDISRVTGTPIRRISGVMRQLEEKGIEIKRQRDGLTQHYKLVTPITDAVNRVLERKKSGMKKGTVMAIFEDDTTKGWDFCSWGIITRECRQLYRRRELMPQS